MIKRRVGVKLGSRSYGHLSEAIKQRMRRITVEHGSLT
jgi:hypothetical protein